MHIIRRVKVAILAVVLCGAAMSPGYAAEDVVFGQVASLTSPVSASYVRGLRAGITACFESVNARGGVHGRLLKLETRDDSLQAPKMLEQHAVLVKDPSIVGLIGYLNTAGIKALVKENAFGRDRIALIAPVQGDQDVVESDNVFPFRSGYAQEVERLLKEAKSWDKTHIAIVSMSVGFGPVLADLVQVRAKDFGLTVVSRSVLNVAPESLPATTSAATKEVVAKQPKAIILLAAGRTAAEFVKALRASSAATTQIYGLSVLDHEDLVKAVGPDSARGIVLTQVIPYPFTQSAAVISDYQRAMKQYAPAEPISLSSLEGYLGARIAVEAARRAGASANRDRLIAALRTMKDYDLGGVSVSYTAERRRGWGGVELTIVNAAGNLRK